MTGSTPNGGYTIVEVLIFMAVSAAMFVSAMLLIGGQQNKAQFQTAVKELEATIRSTLGDVSTGYYRNKAGFGCSLNGGVPNFTASANAQGTNQECITIGRVLHFDVANNTALNIYDIVGRRQYNPSGRGQ